MTKSSKVFAQGAAWGGAAVFVLIWLFPVLAPVSGGLAAVEDYDELPALERIQKRGVARIGFANEAPYAYLDPYAVGDDGLGRLTGEAPEVARAVLAQLGVERIEGVLTEFGSMIPGLKAGRFDLIAAGMYITPKRCREVDFSNPTYSIAEAVVVRAGNPRDIHSYADVAADPDATLGVVTGAIQRSYALEEDIPAERIKVFADAPSALAGVRTGRIDAYAGTSLTVKQLLDTANDPTLERAAPFESPIINGRPAIGYGAFAFRQGDDDLREAFNRELAKLVGSERHVALVEPFGFSQADLPQGKTAAELCHPDMVQEQEQ